MEILKKLNSKLIYYHGIHLIYNDNIIDGYTNLEIYKTDRGELINIIGFSEVGNITAKLEVIQTINKPMCIFTINDILISTKYRRTGIFKAIVSELKSVFDMVTFNNVINPVVKKFLIENHFYIVVDKDNSKTTTMVWKRDVSLVEINENTQKAKDIVEKAKKEHNENIAARKLKIKHNPIEVLVNIINDFYSDVDFSMVDINFSTPEDDENLRDTEVTPIDPNEYIGICGYTYIPDNKMERSKIVINAEMPMSAIVETIAHEAAHYIDKSINVDTIDDHGSGWEKIFNNIHEIYSKVSWE